MDVENYNDSPGFRGIMKTDSVLNKLKEVFFSSTKIAF